MVRRPLLEPNLSVGGLGFLTLALLFFSPFLANFELLDLELDLDEIVLSPDQTSPLAMLTTEALTNVLKYASADPGGRRFVRMAFKLDDPVSDTVRLDIENSVASDVQDTPTGLGSRLITAFSSQLEASVERSCEGGSYRLSVVFKRAPIEFGSEGTATAAATL